MTTWDTAVALEKLLATALPDSQRRLAEEIGKSHTFVQDHLNLLKESEPKTLLV